MGGAADCLQRLTPGAQHDTTDKGAGGAISCTCSARRRAMYLQQELTVNDEVPTGGSDGYGEAGNEVEETHDSQDQKHAGAGGLDQ